MLFQENRTITATEDVSAALSAIREAVAVLAARNRDIFSTWDFEELQLILDACDRIQDYHLVIRAIESKRHLESINR